MPSPPKQKKTIQCHFMFKHTNTARNWTRGLHQLLTLFRHLISQHSFIASKRIFFIHPLSTLLVWYWRMYVYNPADSHYLTHSQLRWKACRIQWGMGVFWWQRLCSCAYTVSKMTGGWPLSYDYSKVKATHTSKWILRGRWICTLLNHTVKKHWRMQKNKKGESVRLQCSKFSQKRNADR